MRVRRLPIFFGIHLLILSCRIASAAAFDDAFQSAHQLKSRYYTIYLKEGVDADRLAMKISVPSGIQSILHAPIDGYRPYQLEDQVDLLYLVVAELLDTQLKQFESSIKICEDAECLSSISQNLFGREIQSGGFYVVALDSLYIDSENVTLYILGHEMAHALLSHYFAVPPPERIQEVLAGYVEYELRKSMR